MRVFIFSLLIVFPVLMTAQEFNTEVLSKVSKEVCDCLEKQDNLDDVTVGVKALETCMTTAMLTNVTYLKDNGYDLMNNNPLAEKFGENLALDLIQTCQQSVPLLVELGRKYNEQKEQSDEYEEDSEPLPFVVGKVQEVEKGTFPIIRVVDIDGRKHNLLWLTMVDNPAEFEESLKGKKNFVLEYYESELYDARIKEYRWYKILNAVRAQ